MWAFLSLPQHCLPHYTIKCQPDTATIPPRHAPSHQYYQRTAHFPWAWCGFRLTLCIPSHSLSLHLYWFSASHYMYFYHICVYSIHLKHVVSSSYQFSLHIPTSYIVFMIGQVGNLGCTCIKNFWHEKVLCCCCLDMFYYPPPMPHVAYAHSHPLLPPAFPCPHTLTSMSSVLLPTHGFAVPFNLGQHLLCLPPPFT